MTLADTIRNGTTHMVSSLLNQRLINPQVVTIAHFMENFYHIDIANKSQIVHRKQEEPEQV